jgi:hypothetical protein
VACRACADECEKHAAHHEHCRLCAEVCRRCDQACRELVAAIASQGARRRPQRRRPELTGKRESVAIPCPDPGETTSRGRSESTPASTQQ